MIAAIVLAAGLSRRMGAANKLLMPWPSGGTVLTASLSQVLATGAAPVILVTGHERAAVERATFNLPISCVQAPDYADGLSASLRAGIAAVPADCEGALICLGDMPFVPASVMQAMMAAFAPDRGQSIIRPCFGGQNGNPILWGRAHFAALSGLTGDRGARDILAARTDVHLVTVDSAGILDDLDTPEQFAAISYPG
ncbi:nucleotidyltransferase family protein [Acidisoma cellulosilytica]|uniref:Nucleotidyltransferase family protein n=1 Tax=Acidisoma cellulosilyticum TaxID=2802395 RepID=A0A964E545_9PROT|nr:nucleotidyltransferase family protein [Acidisoma cellulosilyticum]MCB8882017.1 nucleotidyltransferase family protein [Acidisoma cellulosilyticum]